MFMTEIMNQFLWLWMFKTKDKLLERRTEVFKIINGEVFWILREWPPNIRRVFLEKNNEQRRNISIVSFPVKKWNGTND